MDSVWLRASGALAVSVALHGSLFFGFRSPAAAPTGLALARPLLVRMLPAPFAMTDAEFSERMPDGERRSPSPLATPVGNETAAASSKRIPVLASSLDMHGESTHTEDLARTQSPRESPEAAHSSEAATSVTPTRRAVPTPEPGLAPAPAYLFGPRLDPGPRPLHDIEPEFPPEAGLQEGVVVLRILISEAGAVDEVAVVRSSPKGLFESSALAAFGSAEFSPGMVLGIPVKSQVTVEVNFTPFNRGTAVSGRSY
jgi:TonB family protein